MDSTSGGVLADFSGVETRPVVVVLGQPDATLASAFQTVGLAAIARDGEVVIWGPPSAPDPQPMKNRERRPLMSIADAALALSIDHDMLYLFIGRGQLEVVQVGRKARIPVAAVVDLVADRAGRRYKSGLAAQ